MEMQTVQPDNVIVSEYNERQEEIDDDRLETLIDSVREVGVATPVMLRHSNNDDVEEEYEVIIGQRRVAAAQAAELFSIPAIVTDWDNEDALAASISENVETFSQSVSTKDRAEALAKLWEEMDGEGRPQASKLSERLGVAVSTVSRWLEPLRDEWKGTELDPINEDKNDSDENDDEETETDETKDFSEYDEIDDEEPIEENDSEAVPNPDKRPDDANEFDDDPIDEVGDIDVNDERPAEDEDEDDDEEYTGIDPYTDGADTKPGMKDSDDDTQSGNLQDPEENNTEVPEPTEDSDEDTDEGNESDEENEDEDDVLSDLRPELSNLSTVKLGCVRRMTGGGDDGIEALELIHENDLSNEKVREVEQRVNNGEDVIEAIESVADQNSQDGPSTRIHFTVNGDVAEEVEKRAEEQSTSVHEVARDGLQKLLFPNENNEGDNPDEEEN